MKKEVIGNATLYLGDCLEILPGISSIDSFITDPPYNVGKDYGEFKDNLENSAYESWMRKIIEQANRISERQFWVSPRYKNGFFINALNNPHEIVIRRGASGPFRGGWSDQFETALAVGKPNKVSSDLWEDIRLKGEGYFFREDSYGHPGYTPFRIMERAVDLMSNDSVIDPFLGTGTTGVAAVALGRKFIGIELDEKWYSVACINIDQAQKQQRLFA